MTEGNGRAPRGSRPVVLCVLDGWGYRAERDANAVALARTPNFDRLWRDCPHSLLRTDGAYVGLPEGQFGNSEVGHMNLGAGRVIMQELPRIDAAIADGSLARSEVLAAFVEQVKSGSGRVHLLGLVSPGGVHAHQSHIVALARLLAAAGLEVCLHAFTDGRDTPPRSAAGYLDSVWSALEGTPGLTQATLCGRYFAMDRDKRWERTERAYRAIVAADAPSAASWGEAIAESYAAGTDDEFVEPRVIEGYPGVGAGDGLLCANFRADRVRQILGALLAESFEGFDRGERPQFIAAAGMTSYSSALDERMAVLFSPNPPADIMGEIVAREGLRQLRMAETEKYPHVTFFFNGGEERLYPNEERIMVPSPKVGTYDLQPEMSAAELTDRFCEAVEQGFDFILINYANPDMVGHTGKLDAAIRAVEAVDSSLGRLVEAVGRAGGVALVTADHGNCEVMVDPQTGGAHTAHTTNPVPCLLVHGPAGLRLKDGSLADVAPTLLELLQIGQPAAMTGRSLLSNAAAATN
jgi:2,3-bisphosphoglycerate-independent phosphoglycerate mutase